MAITPGAVIEAADVNALALLTVAETQVYAAAPPVAWTDLDLSATIGAKACLVFLKITETANVSALLISVRKNGDTDEFTAGAAHNIASVLAGQNSTYHVVVAVFTDAAGIIEWKSNAANACTVDVMGYVAAAG